MRRLRTVIAGVGLVGLVAACATSPLGRTQLTIMSEPEMASMGVQAFGQMRQEMPISNDRAKRALVECVANSITSVLTPRDLGDVVIDRWEVELFDEPSANAFALPGGKMGVHTGLLDVARTPDQLAAVMGHEVAHVLAKHGNERVSQTMVAEGLLGVATATVMAGGDSPQRQSLMAALGVGAQLGIMKFGRTHESEADEIGLKLMARAGFDPRHAVDLWQNMGAAGGQQPPEFLSTHPSHETRISRLQAAMPGALDLYQQTVAAGRRASCR